MKKSLPLIFILLTVAIDAIGIGLIMPVMPDLIAEVRGGTLANAAIWGGVLASVFAVMQFLCGPLMGSLSDRFGRRPILLGTLFVMTLDYIIMALAGTIWLLLLGRVIGGVMAATQSVAGAYIADISKPEQKAANFGLIGAAFGIGFVLGPLIGGVLGEFGTRAPFYAAAALAAGNLLLGYFALPETVTDRIRRPFDLPRANPFHAFRHVGALPGVGRMLVVYFLYQVAFWVYPAVWAYYTRAAFGWQPGMVGLSLASFGISMALVQGLLIRPVLNHFGERRTVVLAIGYNFFVFIILAFLSNGTLALILTPLTALGALVLPSLQGMMSRRVADNSQGELQGVLSSASAMSMVISPLLMTQIFAWFTAPDASMILPGAPFLLSAALMIACLCVFLTRPRKQPA